MCVGVLATPRRWSYTECNNLIKFINDICNNRDITLCPGITSVHLNNTQLVQKLKLGFKRTINWNKYQSKVLLRTPNQYLDYFIDPNVEELEKKHSVQSL